MKSRFAKLSGALGLLLLGAAVPVAVVWNPLHWSWADGITSRLSQASSGEAAPGDAKKQLWTCGMHPQVIQDHPGDCPICGMRLVPVKSQAPSPATTATQERKIKYWRAPMDPNYISDKPGKSPMGMDLVPVYEDEQQRETGIRVDPSFLQNFAVRTVRAETGSIPVDIRTVGLLDYNERDLVQINTKFEGWIEKAHVNYVGEPVRKGQVLFEIYSPQLVTTQQEYLSALEYVQRLSGRAAPDAVARARSLLESTRERLRYWDITEDQIDELQRTGKTTRTLNVVSPATGVVVSKMGDSLEGMKLAAGMNVYKVADLSTVWAAVEVYEDQIRYMHPGQQADITVDAFPNRRWSGKVIYLDPSLNQQTRTLKAYVEIPNEDERLRPQMYANVRVRVPAVSGAVKVPEEAVLHSGERSVVIVQKATGLFEPRQVELGALGGGYREIRRGLRAGETVVTSSQFLIDSESNLKAAIQSILAQRTAAAAPTEASPAPPAAPPAMPDHQCKPCLPCVPKRKSH